MSDVVKQIMEAEVALGGGFDWRFSLPFPTVWPLVAGPTIVSYGAGLRRGSSPTLFEHSALLCRVVHDPARRLFPTFERLASTVEAAGVTATRPISSTELEQVNALPLVDDLFFEMVNAKTSPALEAAIRTRVDFFEKTHGWMFAMIAPFHPAFTTWLRAAR